MPETNLKYAKTQVVIHWLTLILLLGSFVSREAMSSAWEVITTEGAEGFAPDIGTRVHVALGVTILALTLLRIALRIRNGAPPPVEGQHPLITIASASVHGLLYLIVLAMPLAGMAAWFGGFGDLADVHGVLFIVLLVLLAAHVAAALFHQFVIGDNLLSRMRLKR